jgi:hypothetical protein
LFTFFRPDVTSLTTTFGPGGSVSIFIEFNKVVERPSGSVTPQVELHTFTTWKLGSLRRYIISLLEEYYTGDNSPYRYDKYLLYGN